MQRCKLQIQFWNLVYESKYKCCVLYLCCSIWFQLFTGRSTLCRFFFQHFRVCKGYNVSKEKPEKAAGGSTSTSLSPALLWVCFVHLPAITLLQCWAQCYWFPLKCISGSPQGQFVRCFRNFLTMQTFLEWKHISESTVCHREKNIVNGKLSIYVTVRWYYKLFRFVVNGDILLL